MPHLEVTWALTLPHCEQGGCPRGAALLGSAARGARAAPGTAQPWPASDAASPRCPAPASARDARISSSVPGAEPCGGLGGREGAGSAKTPVHPSFRPQRSLNVHPVSRRGPRLSYTLAGAETSRRRGPVRMAQAPARSPGRGLGVGVVAGGSRRGLGWTTGVARLGAVEREEPLARVCESPFLRGES